MTFFANIDPAGAVGGRFIRIFDASGTSDARRMFVDDKSMPFDGSTDSAMSSSWNDTETGKRRETVSGRYVGRSSHVYAPDLPILRSEVTLRSAPATSPLMECSSFSESLPPGLSNDTSVTMSHPPTADRALTGVGAFETLIFGRQVDGRSSLRSTKNFGLYGCDRGTAGCCC